MKLLEDNKPDSTSKRQKNTEVKELKRKILWAPWRIKYIQGLSNKSSECFLCHNLQNPQEDDKNFVLWRTAKSIVVLNHYPYNNGHLLIAPARHVGELGQTSDEELLELVKLIRETQKGIVAGFKTARFQCRDEFRQMRRSGSAGPSAHSHCPAMGR